VKNSTAKNNKSPWLPLALALAVNAAMPLAFAADPIHIRAQPLGQALSELGQQTSLQVFFSPDLVAGKQAPAVDGNLSPEDALRRLLQGSGLDYQINEGSVTLSPAPSAAANGPLELGVTDIKMVGDWLGDADAAVVQNHPGARTVIRREAMVEQGAMNVSDVLKRVPGVQVQDSNGTGGSDISLNVGVRGLTSRLSPRSTVLIDGVPAAFAPYGQPQLSMAPISSGNLDSIDVVRGAGSVRYGPQNVGGVINFVTRASRKTPPVKSAPPWKPRAMAAGNISTPRSSVAPPTTGWAWRSCIPGLTETVTASATTATTSTTCCSRPTGRRPIRTTSASTSTTTMPAPTCRAG